MPRAARSTGTISGMSAGSAWASSRTFQFISAGVSAFFAPCFAWLAWNGDSSDSAWRFGLALGGLVLRWCGWSAACERIAVIAAAMRRTRRGRRVRSCRGW